MIRTFIALLFCLTVIPSTLAASETTDNTPEIVKLNPPHLDFYSKELVCRGIPIRAHESVDDRAIQIAYRRLDRQLTHLPQVVENLVAIGAGLHLIGKDH